MHTAFKTLTTSISNCFHESQSKKKQEPFNMAIRNVELMFNLAVQAFFKTLAHETAKMK